MLRTELISFFKERTDMKGLDKYRKEQLEEMRIGWYIRNRGYLPCEYESDKMIKHVMFSKRLRFFGNVRFQADIDTDDFKEYFEEDIIKAFSGKYDETTLTCLMDEYKRVKYSDRNRFEFKINSYCKLEQTHLGYDDYSYLLRDRDKDNNEDIRLDIHIKFGGEWIFLEKYENGNREYSNRTIFERNFQWCHKELRYENLFFEDKKYHI